MYWIPSSLIFSRTCFTCSLRPLALTCCSKSVMGVPLFDLRHLLLVVVTLSIVALGRPQLHGKGLLEVGCSLPWANREKRNGSIKSLALPQMSSATRWPTPIIL